MKTPSADDYCGVFWGSHGCSLPPHDTGHHICTACCDAQTDPEHMAEHMAASPDRYGMRGCAGTYPYYGREAMTGNKTSLGFFTMPPGTFGQVPLPNEFDRLTTPPERNTR